MEKRDPAEATKGAAFSPLTGSDSFDNLLRAAKPPLHDEPARVHEGISLADGRIRIGRRLGAGAMGTVYAATDGCERIAIKVLNRLAAVEIYRLKNEFRRLVDVVHPNVVAARELISEAGEWFFVMEAVHGKPLDTFFRGYDAEREDQLRALMRQLVEGVAAIHAKGLLHRDLKPNNVLVEDSGRVVILDFGLVSEQLAGGPGQTIAGCISGTPAYMAPEQALGLPTVPASDWYAVGVMLYQTLTGRLPITGTLEDVLRAKLTQPIQPPVELRSDLPADLNALCVALLQADQERRPSSAKMLETVSSWPSLDSVRERHSLPNELSAQDELFIGREDTRETFVRALRGFKRGAPQVMWVSGAPGMGKSAVLRHCAQVARRELQVAVLVGRCYQRESVPFKAFDELIDSYTRFVLQLPAEQQAQLVPRNLAYAARLFPVLLRIETFARAARKAVVSDGESELTQRRKAFSGLKDMFSRLADQFLVILSIDDLHWSESDSSRLFLELITPPEPAPVFWLLSARGALAEVEPQLASLPGLQLLSVHLEALAVDDARVLVQRLLGSSAVHSDVADTIVSAAEGVPLYAVQLATHCASVGTIAPDLSMDQVFATRMRDLSPHALTLLEMLALAARPLPLSLARACASEALEQGLRELQSSRWVNTRKVHEQVVFEMQHEGVRMAVLAQLPDDRRRAIHRRLATGLESEANPEPRWLLFHLMGAGQERAAVVYLLRTAAEAAEKLAFGRAADLYLLVLQHASDTKEDIAVLERKCGDALANAGRSSEAAQAYLRAAKRTNPSERMALRRLASTQWLRSGYIQEGVAQLRETVADVGIRWPESVEEAALRFVLARARIRLRGLAFQLRDPADVPPSLLAKLDVLYPAQTSLGTFDYVRGAYFASLALPLALEAGEPKRLVLSLGSEAVYGTMFSGEGNRPRTSEIRARIAEVAQRSGDMYGQGLALMTEALCAYWTGDWGRVAQPARRAEKLFDEHVAGTAWEVSLQRSIRHTVELHAGCIHELRDELPTILREAVDRQDIYSRLDLIRRMAAVHLAQGEEDDAARYLAEMDTILRRTPLPSLRHLVLSTRVSLSLYGGRPRQAKSALREGWKECKKAGLHRLPLLRTMMAGMQADCVVADDSTPPAARARELTRLARQVAREPIAWAQALSHSIVASAQQLEPVAVRAEHALRLASDGFDASGLHGMAAGARFELARLIGTASASSAPGTSGEADLLRFGISDPTRWLRQYRTLY